MCLAFYTSSTYCGYCFDVHSFCKQTKLILNLNCKFTGRYYDQYPLIFIKVYLINKGDEKCSCFTGTGICHTDKIASFKDWRNCLILYGGRNSVSVICNVSGKLLNY